MVQIVCHGSDRVSCGSDRMWKLFLIFYRYEKEEADGTDSTVYSTAVALAIMGCFQVRVSSV